MTPWLERLAGHAEDMGLVSSIHMATVCNFSSRGDNSLFWPPKAPDKHIHENKKKRGGRFAFFYQAF